MVSRFGALGRASDGVRVGEQGLLQYPLAMRRPRRVLRHVLMARHRRVPAFAQGHPVTRTTTTTSRAPPPMTAPG